MSKIIPTYPQKAQRSQRFTFGGKQWICRYTWRERPGAWYFDLFYADGTPAMLGRRLIGGMSPDASIYNEAFPPGKFFTYGPEVYTRFDLNQSLLPMWIPTEEIPLRDDEFSVSVLEGDHSPPFVPVEPPGYCDFMLDKMDDFNWDMFLYACDEWFYFEESQLISWFQGIPSEVYYPPNLDVVEPGGDIAKFLVFEDGDKKYVRTDKDVEISAANPFAAPEGDIPSTVVQIFACFVIRNIPGDTQDIYKIGVGVDTFYIRANSDQTLSFSGIAGTFPYEIDKVYMIYAVSNWVGFDPAKIYIDGVGYETTYDYFEIEGNYAAIGEVGGADGLLVDHIHYFVKYSEEEEVISDPQIIEIAQAIADQYGYSGGLLEGLTPP